MKSDKDGYIQQGRKEGWTVDRKKDIENRNILIWMKKKVTLFYFQFVNWTRESVGRYGDTISTFCLGRTAN